MSKKISGFDLEPAAVWYAENLSRALLDQWDRIRIKALERKYIVPIHKILEAHGEHTERIAMQFLDTGFPPQAMDRSVLTEIELKPPLWFKNDCTPKKTTVTECIDEALSPSAIVPSFIAYNWPDGQPLTACIELYSIPSYPLEVRSIITSQGLVHEIAHSIVISDFNNYKGYLKLPGGRVVESKALILEFGKLVDELKCGPISHYSSTYWSRGKCSIKSDKYRTAIQEELVESITAHLLGFAFCETLPRRKGMGLDPFQDRPQVRDWIKDYLCARRV